MEVPFLDLRAQMAQVKDEIAPLWMEILETAGFIGGPHVSGFEEDFAAACDVKHAVAVNSGTDALRLIFDALDMNPGDEIITVANTFFATIEAIIQAGAIPKLVDVRPDTLLMDPEKLEAAITDKTVGICPVHLYGQTADMDPILEIANRKGLWVVEDAAQAQLAEYKGRRAGSLGRAAGFSFYPGKNLGACGEGGAVTTNDAELAKNVSMLRDHGQGAKYYHDLVGYNARCDAAQAAALRVKLKRLPDWNESRRQNAARYRKNLAGVKGIEIVEARENSLPIYHLFIIQVDNRERIMEDLKAKGIATALHYPVAIHMQKALAHLDISSGSFPVTEAAAGRVLSLPMFPELTGKQIDYVCEALKEAVG